MENIIYFNTIIQPKGGTSNVSIIMAILTFVLIILLSLLTFGIIHTMKNTSLTLTEK
jgi:hypothetical protein